MNKKVQAYEPFVDFLAAALGISTEIALNDFSDLDHSLIKIANGHVSGRSVGAPASNLARKLIDQFADSDLDYVSDYVSKAVDGRPLQSTSFFIRDKKRIVGMLCVNIDPKPYRDLEDALMFFMKAYRHGGSEEFRDTNLDAVRAAYASSAIETLSAGSSTGAASQVEAIVAAMGQTIDDLNQDGRIEVIRKLEKAGVFQIKGAANDVANALQISLPSVYRYLQQVRRNA